MRPPGRKPASTEYPALFVRAGPALSGLGVYMPVMASAAPPGRAELAATVAQRGWLAAGPGALPPSICRLFRRFSG